MPGTSNGEKIKVTFITCDVSTHPTTTIDRPWPPRLDFFQAEMRSPILCCKAIYCWIGVCRICMNNNNGQQDANKSLSRCISTTNLHCIPKYAVYHSFLYKNQSSLVPMEYSQSLLQHCRH